eukprot:scaffold99505_cov20-Tisochrysis_lutea.AAC.2
MSSARCTRRSHLYLLLVPFPNLPLSGPECMGGDDLECLEGMNGLECMGGVAPVGWLGERHTRQSIALVDKDNPAGCPFSSH